MVDELSHPCKVQNMPALIAMNAATSLGVVGRRLLAGNACKMIEQQACRLISAHK